MDFRDWLLLSKYWDRAMLIATEGWINVQGLLWCMHHDRPWGLCPCAAHERLATKADWVRWISEFSGEGV